MLRVRLEEYGLASGYGGTFPRGSRPPPGLFHVEQFNLSILLSIICAGAAAGASQPRPFRGSGEHPSTTRDYTSPQRINSIRNNALVLHSFSSENWLAADLSGCLGWPPRLSFLRAVSGTSGFLVWTGAEALLPRLRWLQFWLIWRASVVKLYAGPARARAPETGSKVPRKRGGRSVASCQVLERGGRRPCICQVYIRGRGWR
jgi:hypothetical protein